MGVISISGKAAWKIVKWQGKKFMQIKDIASLLRDAQLQEQEVRSSQASSKSYLIVDPVILKETDLISTVRHWTEAKILLLPPLSERMNPL